MDEVTFTPKGLGKDGVCKVCGAPVLGCPLDDECLANTVCAYHFATLPGVSSWGHGFQRKGK